MSGGKTTRRAFVGGGVALAAGVGAAKLPDVIGKRRRTLALHTDSLRSAGSPPPFGTLLPGTGARAPLFGALQERPSGRAAGRLTITSIVGGTGMLSIHALDLHDGTLVAIGPDVAIGQGGRSVFPIASGTGAFAGASGSVTIHSARNTALSVDVDLEL